MVKIIKEIEKGKGPSKPIYLGFQNSDRFYRVRKRIAHTWIAWCKYDDHIGTKTKRIGVVFKRMRSQKDEYDWECLIPGGGCWERVLIGKENSVSGSGVSKDWRPWKIEQSGGRDDGKTKL